MAALSMSELVTTDVAQSDAFKRNQALRKPESTRNTSSESDRVGAGVRVLRVLVVAAGQGASGCLQGHQTNREPGRTRTRFAGVSRQNDNVGHSFFRRVSGKGSVVLPPGS